MTSCRRSRRRGFATSDKRLVPVVRWHGELAVGAEGTVRSK